MSEFNKGIIDVYFQDIFNAYRDLRELYEKTRDETAKAHIRKIKTSLDLGLAQLTPCGNLAPKQFEKLKNNWPI